VVIYLLSDITASSLILLLFVSFLFFLHISPLPLRTMTMTTKKKKLESAGRSFMLVVAGGVCSR
jgi:hypothetical protein